MTICARPSDIGVSSKDIQKARQIAKRNRTSIACNRCKASKTKCSDYRPCKHCAMSNAAQSCAQGSQIKRSNQADLFLVPENSNFGVVSLASVRSGHPNTGEFNVNNAHSRNFIASSEEPSTAMQHVRQTILNPYATASNAFGPHDQSFSPSFTASPCRPAHLVHHHPSQAQPCKLESTPWIPYAPTHNPIDIQHLLAQTLLSSRIGLGPALPLLTPLPPPSSAGLPPAVASLLGLAAAASLPAAPTPDAHNRLLLLHAAAAAGRL